MLMCTRESIKHYRRTKTVRNKSKNLDKIGLPGLAKVSIVRTYAYMDYRINSAKRKSAASEMRTLLAGITGVLFIQARRWPKENMTWEIMSLKINFRRRRQLRTSAATKF